MKKKWKMAGFRGSRPLLCTETYKEVAALQHTPCVAGRGRKSSLLDFYALFILLIFCCAFWPVGKVHAEPVKIVIDPGHGGTNLGAKHNGYIEKDMTMAVANAMAEELKKYEGIEVYMTRVEDAEMSLQERADYAKSVGADFFFCLHFNMSENHTLYGSEVWISAFGDCYAKGKSFGDLCLNEMDTLELYRRGVKTRLGKDGTDYYGVIKHCKEYGIPAAIIEHCHLDRKEDARRYETAEALKKLGVLDATAVAKYYRLYSPSTGADYRKFEVPTVEVPGKVMKPDDTEPVDVSLTCLRVREEAGEVNLLLTGKDEDSGLLYYDYSIDGGNKYSDLQKWDIPGNELEFTINIPIDQDIALKCRVYNGYDLDTETETITISRLDGKQEEKPSDIESIDTVENNAENAGVSEQEIADVTEGESEEALETSGSVREIDMGRYAGKDTEKEKAGALPNSEDVSRFLWLVMLGLLSSILIALIILRAAYRKKQKKAGYRRKRR